MEVEHMTTKSKLPDEISLKSLKELFDETMTVYQPAFDRAKILDGTDKGRMWDVIGAKFPPYQILNNTNHVAYVKTNLLANIYTVGRQATLKPTSKDDKDIVKHINIAIDQAWSKGMISYYQMKAGERAALLNKGVTKVSWDNSKTGGAGDNFYKGEPDLSNVDPMKFMSDPYVDEIEDANFAFDWDDLHKNAILRDPDYEKNFKDYLDDKNIPYQGSGDANSTEPITDKGKSSSQGKDMFRIVESYIFDSEGKLWEIHSLGFSKILFSRERKPAILPYAVVYCNLPSNDVFGLSEPAKIYSNSLAYNLTISFGLTAEYKNQRPPRYLNKQSGLNIRAFRKHGNDADHTFITQGDASKAVHYHRFPEISAQGLNLMQTLGFDIKNITGVDDRYTGRDSGSIMTTGGMENMLNQVTAVDQPKIVNYEKYSKRLTQLVLLNMLEFSPKRHYFFKKPNDTKYESIEVDFPEVDSDTLFDYDLNISAVLPKSKQRVAQMANILMEKQMQYAASGQQQVDLITPEEWLMFQDLPNMEYMLDRMNVQRQQDYIDQVSQTVFTYAGLTEKGMDPAEAMVATADILKNKGQTQVDPRSKNPQMQSEISPFESQG